ncbi:MAG TPA: hypothetical protein VMV92_16640 [Streptosporangiaceae bacterium]|nr:hypothetical protein [Streptosporangiaceae bacterium]
MTQTSYDLARLLRNGPDHPPPHADPCDFTVGCLTFVVLLN